MIDQIEDFLLNFTTVLPNYEEGRVRRITCMSLYRHYLAHCQKYGLEMATKDIFAEIAGEAYGMFPEKAISRRGNWDYYYDGVEFIGTVNFLTITPEVERLLIQPSVLEGIKKEELVESEDAASSSQQEEEMQ